MTLALFGSLVVLALIDSTSFGTLLIPLWLMAAPGRPRARRILAFLATVAAFYWFVGLALLWGVDLVFDEAAAIVESPFGLAVLLVVGILLIVWSYRLEAKAKKDRASGEESPGATSRWRARALDDSAGRSGLLPLITLALAAATVELGSMLPYLGAIGVIAASELRWPATAVILAGYCLLMTTPALVLLVVRVLGAGRVEPALRRLERWLTRNAAESLSWITGILGVLLIIHAVRSGVLSVLNLPGLSIRG